MSLSENPFSPMATYDSQTTISSISSLDPKLSRTHYDDGRLLRASDLTRDQLPAGVTITSIDLSTDGRAVVEADLAPGIASDPAQREPGSCG